MLAIQKGTVLKKLNGLFSQPKIILAKLNTVYLMFKNGTFNCLRAIRNLIWRVCLF